MLSIREKQVLDFIKEFRKSKGKVPSARQITFSLGFKSSRSAQNYITTLKEKGLLIDREPETSAYILAEDIKGMVNIPFLGKIAAGHAAEAYAQNDRNIEMPYSFFGEADGQGLFALQVMGNSMSGDFICEGDIAIIKKQRDGFRKDDILAVRVGSEEFTLKRVNLKKNSVQLLPSNPEYAVVEVPFEEVTIIGKYVGLLRRS